jgi:hypothetical protein
MCWEVEDVWPRVWRCGLAVVRSNRRRQVEVDAPVVPGGRGQPRAVDPLAAVGCLVRTKSSSSLEISRVNNNSHPQPFDVGFDVNFHHRLSPCFPLFSARDRKFRLSFEFFFFLIRYLLCSD